MTVCTYLNEYKAAEGNSQANMSHRFSCYLLTVCREKLYRRATSWSALGLMHQLVLATYDSKFEEAITKVQWSQRNPGPGDNTLAIYLAKEDIQQELLPELARVASKVLGADVSFTSLIEAINKRLPGQKPNPLFYNKDTVGEFHILFLACLVSMASAHTQLDKMLRKYPPSWRQTRAVGSSGQSHW
jgi:hypothetical protein